MKVAGQRHDLRALPQTMRGTLALAFWDLKPIDSAGSQDSSLHSDLPTRLVLALNPHRPASWMSCQLDISGLWSVPTVD